MKTNTETLGLMVDAIKEEKARQEGYAS